MGLIRIAKIFKIIPSEPPSLIVSLLSYKQT